ncbi:MAG TPA: biotin/lipoyl-containing protein [Thermoanaerobaculia bacterium]|jgi:3-methylcrotonyl-CoA carboxylase alpha subunit
MSDSVEVIAIHGNEAEIRLGERTLFVPFAIMVDRTGDRIHFALDGETYLVELAQKSGRKSARHRDHSLEAPMPGVVLKLYVESGAVVEKGAPLLILEAMKMEHTLTAPRAGTVAAVNCKEGEMVQPGVELVVIE